MRRLILTAALPIALATSVCTAGAQSAAPAETPDPSPAALRISKLFSQHQEATPAKYGASAEQYLDVRAVPLVLEDLHAYAGTYKVADYGLTLELRVEGDQLVGNGTEPTATWPRSFTLDRIRVDRGLLTARKRYEDGNTASFEAVFMEQFRKDAPDDAPARSLGIGTRISPLAIQGVRVDKLFFEKS